ARHRRPEPALPARRGGARRGRRRPREHRRADARGRRAVSRRSIDHLVEDARRTLRRLTPHEAWAAARDGAVLVDTRSEDERRRQGWLIPGAEHHPLSTVLWRLDPAVETHNAKPPLEARLV